MVHIYILTDPTTFEIRYVGQTIQNLKRRQQAHCDCKDSRHVTYWIKSLKSKGLRPLIEEIDLVEKEDADEAERLYIREYRQLGCPLTNLDSGGRTKYTISEETRKKFSEKSKGRPQSEETRKRRSVSLLGREVTDAMAKALAKGRVTGIKRGPASDKRKRNIGLSNQGRGRLSEEQIREIRHKANTTTYKALGAEYNIDPSYVCAIVKLKAYKWVK